MLDKINHSKIKYFYTEWLKKMVKVAVGINKSQYKKVLDIKTIEWYKMMVKIVVGENKSP